MTSLPETVEIFSSTWRPNLNDTPRHVMLAQYRADPSLFVAYGTDGAVTFGVSGAWSTDLEPFLTLIRATGAEIIRMPSYYAGDYHVEAVAPGAAIPEQFLPPAISPQHIVGDPPEEDAAPVSPAPAYIEACFNGLYGISVAA